MKLMKSNFDVQSVQKLLSSLQYPLCFDPFHWRLYQTNFCGCSCDSESILLADEIGGRILELNLTTCT